ncbi:MAG: acyl-ACP--UDP-N-acetylglucosamine O-acyltransferase [Oligoflexia bacterium]|nr:acyl-ACP--UDP-N-acetylglucosamine O-acyltransferase [Oligoflexia bacterium]MBF0366008.1 acyl-ACP--UDP-N-acetylglucosamine O-acyltransferase [Oligoflexia bacterium]
MSANNNSNIHATAVIYEGAKVHPEAKIGPYCVVGANVEIDEGTLLHAHVVIDGHTTIGKGNQFYPFCSIGAPPQDTSYKGQPTKVVIGNNNTFREYVSVHRGTLKQDEITIIGDNCFFMAYVHIAHDVAIGNKVVIVNSVNLAGHVSIGNNVIIGGGTNIGQFISLGRGSYIGGATAIDRDIPPFCTAYGNRVQLKGINIIGLRRQGHDRRVISETTEFYRAMEASSLSPRTFVEKEEHWQEYKENPLVQEMVSFIKKSEIGIASFNS